MTSRRHRYPPARYLKGPPQVHRRSAETGAPTAAGSRFIRGQSLHSAGHAWARHAQRAARRASANEAPRRQAEQSPQSKALPRYQEGSRDCMQIPWAMRGPDRRTTSDLPAPGGLFTEDRGRRNPRASGSVNRWLWPDSVRHMSVTTAMQGLTAAQHDTQRDNTKTARKPRYAQAMGYFRR